MDPYVGLYQHGIKGARPVALVLTVLLCLVVSTVARRFTCWIEGSRRADALAVRALAAAWQTGRLRHASIDRVLRH